VGSAAGSAAGLAVGSAADLAENKAESKLQLLPLKSAADNTVTADRIRLTEVMRLFDLAAAGASFVFFFE
jgi:hypothetical protein